MCLYTSLPVESGSKEWTASVVGPKVSSAWKPKRLSAVTFFVKSRSARPMLRVLW